MSSLPAAERSAQPRLIHLVIVEPDPVMRTGLLTCLQRFGDLRVVADVETAAAALRIVVERQRRRDDRLPATSESDLDLVVCGLPLGDIAVPQSGLGFCRQLKGQFANLPMLLLVATQDPGLLIARRLGIEGCWARGSSVLDLVTAIRRLAAGQTDWSPALLQALAIAARDAQSPQLNPFGTLRRNLRTSSLSQITDTLTQIEAALRSDTLSPLDRLFLEGRQRELKAARWLVQRLLSSQTARDLPVPPTDGTLASLPTADTQSITRLAESTAIVDLTPRDLQARLFDGMAAKLQFGLDNLTDSPLEIDLFKEEKKRELFYLILRQLEALLDELRFSQVQPGVLPEKQAAMVLDLWQSVTTEFFGRYYALPLRQQELEVVPTLLQDGAIVQTAILDKIPAVADLLSHLVFQTPLTIDHTQYPVGTPAAYDRASALLENLTIQLANAVVQPFLNRFADVEAVKQRFYDRRLLSTRDIERFRNNLSWRYRIEATVLEPKAIFESQYRLLVFTSRGIKRIAIYAPRGHELDQLTGIRFAVTLALETRDAIAPRLRAAIAFLGSGVVYVLTEVVGRGIGLIGRGVLKGIGNAWQDSKISRGSDTVRATPKERNW